MLIVTLSVLALLALTTLLHYEVLSRVDRLLPRLVIPHRTQLLVVMFAVLLAHALEILLYGVTLYGLQWLHLGSLTAAGLPHLVNSLYFSAETFTSLGFGDLVPVGPLRLLAGTEALNGLVLIGWSASYTYLAMERFWNEIRLPVDASDR
ncbi:two pore domain potassium channel family protein [Ideonella sp. B7]|uniref:potassium channel family protein n=1 Tax=Ideonella benzenivorans TaxID=2831643 RepID=UPI001CED0C1A|nr:potassium channel family protein [Ideonella benzenivorans]MCA6218261.1 two pore domain potassium channel family protein [Ideonella benzenivorans]